MTLVRMRLDGDYVPLDAPLVEGLIVQSVDVAPASLQLRFTNGTVLLITRRIDEPEFHVLHLVESRELVDAS